MNPAKITLSVTGVPSGSGAPLTFQLSVSVQLFVVKLPPSHVKVAARICGKDSKVAMPVARIPRKQMVRGHFMRLEVSCFARAVTDYRDAAGGRTISPFLGLRAFAGKPPVSGGHGADRDFPFNSKVSALCTASMRPQPTHAWAL